MNTSDAKRVLETALICAAGPLPLPDMRALFDGQVGTDTVRRLLDELINDWQDRGVELVALASGWRLQSRPEMREYLDRFGSQGLGQQRIDVRSVHAEASVGEPGRAGMSGAPVLGGAMGGAALGA